MATFDAVVANLENIGIFEFFLPFVILFAVMYGLLTKTKIFGEPKDAGRINAVISFAAAAFIMLYPTTHSAVFELTDFLANMIGGTLIYIFAILAFIIVMFMVAVPLGGGQNPDFGKKAGIIGVGVAVILVGVLFFSSGGAEIFPGVSTNFSFTGFSLGGGYVDPSVMALVIILLVMGLAVYWITK